MPRRGRTGGWPDVDRVARRQARRHGRRRSTALRGTPTVMLASGDPLWFGMGATLHAPPPARRVPSSPRTASSFQLAAARLRWPLQHVVTLSAARPPARNPSTPHRSRQPHPCRSPPTPTTAPHVATCWSTAAMAAPSSPRSKISAAPSETHHLRRSAEPSTSAIGDFYVLAIDCVADPGAPCCRPSPASPTTPSSPMAS